MSMSGDTRATYGATEIEAFLTHLAIAGKESAFDPEPGEEGAAIFYRQVLEIDEPWLTDVAAADIDPHPVSSGAATATKKYCSGA